MQRNDEEASLSPLSSLMLYFVASGQSVFSPSYHRQRTIQATKDYKSSEPFNEL